MTTHPTIREWWERGKKVNATHMIIVCDTFDHGDYPVYISVTSEARARSEAEVYNLNMQRVMEVYSYAIDLDEQINEYRSFHYECEDFQTKGKTKKIIKALDSDKIECIENFLERIITDPMGFYWKEEAQNLLTTLQL